MTRQKYRVIALLSGLPYASVVAIFAIVMSMNSSPVLAAQLSDLSVTSTNNLVNANSYYDIIFNTRTVGVIKTIEISFLSNFDLSGAKLIEKIGIGDGTLSVSGGTLRYTVESPTSVPAGTNVRLEVANIVNSNNPTRCCDIIVQTRGPTGNVIDGPTESAFTLKEIRIPIQ